MKNQYEEPEKVQLDLNEFEVARSEFFAHMREPSFIFNEGKVGVNTACVRRLPEVDYVQILINPKKQKLAVRVCQEEDLCSILWAKVTKDGKRLPRTITGRMFFMKVCDMMDWNPDYRYKILGKLVKANNELLYLFDLNSAETFERSLDENGKRKASRKPVFPEEWKNQFGIPFSEHKKALQVSLFDGYTVFSVKDQKDEEQTEKGDETNDGTN